MKLRVERDSDDILKFYIVPVNRAKIAALLVGGIYQGLRSGSAGQDSALDTKKDVAGAVVNAFKETVAYAWLLENARGKAGWGGDFSDKAGLIPMPRISELDLKDEARFGVAIDGATQSWPGYYLPPALPMLDSLTRRATWIEIFPRGTRPVETRITVSDPWIMLKETKAFGVGRADRRWWVEIDWAKLPPGRATGTISVSDTSAMPPVSITVKAMRATAEQEKAAKGAWGSMAGPFAIPADGYARNVPAGHVQWEAVPDYGRVATAMSIFPTNAPAMGDPRAAPRMEYPIFVGEAGEWTFDVVIAPTLRINPENPLSLSLWIDDGPPQIVAVFTPEALETQEFLGKQHDINARADMHIMHFTAAIAKPGRHVLTVAMVDPTIVVQSIIAYRDTLPPSYFGPPPLRIGAQG